MASGIVVAIIAAAVVSVFVIFPASDFGSDDRSLQPPYDNSADTSAGLYDDDDNMGNQMQPQQPSPPAPVSTPSYTQRPDNASYGSHLSLVEIFEDSESGVVRINVQRSPQIQANDNGVGSGFVYDMQGHIVTNLHVIQEAEAIYVTFLDGRIYEAAVVGEDKFTDIAVIKANVDKSSLHPLTFGNSSELRVGEQVASIGNPFGLSGSMTSGIVSQVGRLLPSSAGYSIPDVIQTDAAINPGNSGGPLLNMHGEVVGINNAIQSTTGEFAGVGFAIPSLTAVTIVPTLIEEGSYSHPWIGISGRDIDIETARLMGIDDVVGFLVVDVISGSPAEDAGLHPSETTATIQGEEIQIGGDVILGIDGNDVRKIADILIHLQRSKSVGDELVLDVLRDGQMIQKSLVLQTRPAQ